MAHKPFSIVLSVSIAIVLIAVLLLYGCSGPSDEPPTVSGGGICVTTQFSLFVEGQSVLDAERGDFEVFERAVEANGDNGQSYVDSAQVDDTFAQRPICVFEPPGDVGAQSSAVALVLDRSGSMGGQRIVDLKVAANLFVSQMRPQDVTEIISFSSSFTRDQVFTSDQSLLTAAINGLSAGGGTDAWTAGDAGLTDLLARTEDARALLIMSDGASSGNKEQLVANAQAVGIPIFTIGFQAPQQGEDDLRSVAENTGGEFFAPTTQQELIAAFQAVSQGVQNVYTIGWVTQMPRGQQGIVKIVYTPSDPDTEIVKGFTVPLNGEGT